MKLFRTFGASTAIARSERKKAARYANRQSGQAQTLVIVGSTPSRATFWVVLLAAACKAVVKKQARWATRGSIPSRLTGIDTARSSSGRMRDPHSRGMGSIPIRAAETWPSGGIWYTRDTQNVVSIGHASSILALATRQHVGIADAAGAQLAFIRPVSPARYRDLQLAGGPVLIRAS